MPDLVTVIVPTFNRGYIIRNAIDSVRAQTHENWESIIIDDGSTDDTKAIVESYGDSRIRYEYQENRGQSAARNRGLEMAKGKWITFLDSDNEFLPPFLERALALFARNPNALCIIPKGNRTYELYENGKLIRTRSAPSNPPENATDVAKELFMRSFIFEMNAFIHSSSIRDEGIRFDESISSMEDWDYSMTIAERHPDSFLYLPEVSYNYHQRYGGDGIVSNMTYLGWADTFEKMYQKHKNDRLMEGQTWYPHRVEKWRKIAADFERGIEPPPHLYYFKD